MTILISLIVSIVLLEYYLLKYTGCWDLDPDHHATDHHEEVQVEEEGAVPGEESDQAL